MQWGVLLITLMILGETMSLRADIVDDPDQVEPVLSPPTVPKGETPVKATEKGPDKSTAKKAGGTTAASPSANGPVIPSETPPGNTSKSNSAKKNSNRSPIRLKSDGKSTYTKNGRLIQLNENVVISQDQLRLQADDAKVHLAEEGADNNVEKVEINGNVRVSNFSDIPEEKVSARGDRAFFINKNRTITLVGNARLWKGGHLIKGKQITYDVDTGVITVDKAEGVVKPEEVQGKGKKH